MGIEKSDLLQGTLDLLILRVVAMGPIHGYAISKRIQQISRDALRIQQGSLYPALHRLEKRKWLGAEWREAETGRAAKFYSLTAEGRKRLLVEHSEWERLSAAIGLVIQATQL
ncbi:MAG: PadR family transcriptional regulator [Opitutaceae bacterium]